MSNNVLEEINDWDELKIHRDLLKGIYAYGFEKPSSIQKKGILPIINKEDILAQAQSGTGKTGTFTIGALANLNLKVNSPQVIILSPTRELSKQIHDVMFSIGSFMKDLSIKLLVGGNAIDSDIDDLKNNKNHVLVGCPGRVHDMIRRKFISTTNIKLIVLDEADELLSEGFKEQVNSILEILNKNIQLAFFSATVPTGLEQLIQTLNRNPKRIRVKQDMLTLEGIQQYYVLLENDVDKYNTLKEIYSKISMSQTIIYCNSIKRVADLYDAMIEDDYPVCRIHSNMDKKEREQSYNDFKNGKYRVLLSSNITSRGIDIQQVSTVINFDIPKCEHNYLHRIGRSGRWGRKGLGINFITKRDIKKMKEIESFYHTEINELTESVF